MTEASGLEAATEVQTLVVDRAEVERFIDCLCEARDEAYNWLNSGEPDAAIASALYVAADDVHCSGAALMNAIRRWEAEARQTGRDHG